MMRTLLVTGILAAAMALCACDNPPLPAYQAKFDAPQFSMTDWGLQQDLRVSKAVTNLVGAGQLQVAIELENNTDHVVKADYRYTFLDKNGVAIDPASAWTPVNVPPRGFQQFTITSMSPAADFRVELRPQK